MVEWNFILVFFKMDYLIQNYFDMVIFVEFEFNSVYVGLGF